MTFSKSDEHSGAIFKILNMLKIPDLVSQNIAIFMYKYHHALTSIIVIIQDRHKKSRIIFLRLEQIMEFSILDS